MERNPILKIKMTADDLAHFSMFWSQYHQLWKYHWTSMAWIVLAFMSGWIAFIFMLPIEHNWLLAVISTGLAMGLPLLNGRASTMDRQIRLLRKHFSIENPPQEGIIDRDTTLEVTSSHFLASNSHTDSRTILSNVRLYEDENYYYILVSAHSGFVINKMTYSGEELDDFIETVRKKIPS